ncbi:hypothetical protein Pla123a_38170 [Posidoniimonas polymericola]|uniref:Zinc-finger domain-containing protein n=1 Tax=Posidoniimonas polymericola TaxID=2528002 RepID=A0A5C5YG54_9BACT|nr:hypothetical protein [Posidoniimonas polymericola]TWT73481.1 hypothetical protein Pla123a_38170 [Posidoniimonas polymericola]
MSTLRAIKMLLTLRCEESARLLSDASFRSLSPVERWSVRLHQVSCKRCRQLASQLSQIDQAARSRVSQAQQMPDEMRQRIARSVAQARGTQAHGDDA